VRHDRQGLESAFAASSTLLPLPRFGGGLSALGCLDGFERDYELGEEIGSGSFGTVFVASSLHDGEEVAVKVCCLRPAVEQCLRLQPNSSLHGPVAPALNWFCVGW